MEEVGETLNDATCLLLRSQIKMYSFVWRERPREGKERSNLIKVLVLLSGESVRTYEMVSCQL